MNQRILKLRAALGLTQAEFAEKIRMEAHAVYKWERGLVDIKPSSLLLIELVFSVNPDWLRSGKGAMFLPTLTPKLEQFVEWMKSLPDNKKIWLEVEFEERLNQYRKWGEQTEGR